MNRESIRNKRIVALVLALVIIIIGLGSDLLASKFMGAKIKEETYFKDQFASLAGKSMGENLISGTDSENRILVVNMDGVIADTGPSFGLAGYDHANVLDSLDEAMDDESIKGMILRVNSPGGTVYHSAEVWDRIQKLKEARQDLTIYTSMGSVAASGGYYVAAPTDKIFASEETITGSIGVIGDYINYQGLEEKLGIKHNVFKSAKHKDIGSASREMTDEERQILQSSIDEFYNKFVKVVSDGRKMDEAKTRSIADGRVYTGRQALKNGLVDEIGYFEDVLDAMTRDLALDDPEVFEINSSLSMNFSSIFGGLSESADNPLNILSAVKRSYGNNGGLKLYYMYGGF